MYIHKKWRRAAEIGINKIIHRVSIYPLYNVRIQYNLKQYKMYWDHFYNDEMIYKIIDHVSHDNENIKKNINGVRDTWFPSIN